MYLVQLLALAIYAIVMIGALKDFKRTILIWVPMSLLFSPQVCVLYSNPITALTVAVDLSLVLIYLFFKKGKYQKEGFNDEQFFFMPAIYVMMASYILATLFSEMPFGSSVNRFVKTTVDYFGIIIILFRCLNTREDVMLFAKSLALAAFIFCADGIIEGIIHENLWGDFLFFNSRCDEVTEGRGWHFPNYLTGGKMRYGMIRCYSFFNLHLVFGFACCLVLYVLMVLFNKNEILIGKRNGRLNTWTYYVLFAMLVLGIVFSNSKGPMICTIFILLTQYGFKQLFQPLVMAPLIIGIVIISVYFPDYILNFLSLVDEDVAEEGNGSSLALREQQFEVALRLFERSPLFGNGINAVSYYRQFGFDEILGAESVWLKVLPDQGLFGVVAYIFMYIKLKAGAENYIPFKVWFFFLLAIFVFDTTNGSPYGRLIWWIGCFLAIRRYYQLENEKYII